MAQDIQIVRPADDGRELVLARWGLVPAWAKDLKIGYKRINGDGRSGETGTTSA